MKPLQHTVLLASAGTGKTFQLTNRYLQLLSAGCKPDLILATTFTRKAAGEIADRLLKRLAGAATESDSTALAELRKEVDDELDAARCGELLLRLLNDLHRMQVLTIDAFLLHIADSFCLELGISPGWGIVDDAEDREMQAEAVHQALTDANPVELRSFFENLAQGDAKRSIQDAYLDTTRSAHAAYMQSKGIRQLWTLFGPRVPPLGSADLLAALRALEELPPAMTKAGKPSAAWVKTVGKSLVAAGAGDWQAFLKRGIPKAMCEGAGSFSKIWISPEAAAVFQPLVDHATSTLLAGLKKRNLATFDLTQRFDQAYRHVKDARGRYCFDDVPRLLNEFLAVDATEELYYRLDGRIDHLLLDEFQDTSITQFKLLEPILDELLSYRPESRSVFCVGDVKQSLYAWREAEPDLLPALPQRWTDLKADSLYKSYRSSPLIIDTVNRVFKNIGQSPGLADRKRVLDQWETLFTEHEAEHQEMAGAMRVYTAPAEEDTKNKEQMIAAAKLTAERAEALRAEAPGASIGILVRTKAALTEIMRELTLKEIPVSKEAGNPLADTPGVTAALSLLRLADHPSDTASLYHVATSPIGPSFDVTDFTDRSAGNKLAADVRTILMRDGYASLFGRILQRCAGCMNAHSAQRFGQLIELAESYDSEPGLRPSSFAEMVMQHPVPEPASEQVRIMTIHAAKGLEFDAVILPQLFKRWNVRSGQVIVDRGDDPLQPISAVTCYPNELLRSFDPNLARLYERCLDREIVQELCALYVAMTRAIHVLEMIVPSNLTGRNNPCAAQLLRSTLVDDQDGDPAGLLEEKTMGDWAAQVREKTSEHIDTSDKPAAMEVVLARTSGTQARRLRRRSPSSLEGGTSVDLSELLSLGDESATQRGKLVHRWCEQIEWLDDGIPSEAELIDQAAQWGWTEQTAREDAQIVAAALATGPLAELLREDSYRDRSPGVQEVEVRNEWPFALRDDDDDKPKSILLTGQFDRLVIGRLKGKAVWADIIDFKSDRVSPEHDPKGFEQRIEFYRPQLLAYRRAAARLLSLSEGSVSCRIAFVSAGVIHDYTKPSEAS